jgi:hypothetical protein
MTDESQTNNLVPREVIRFLTLRGLTATQILGEMQVYGSIVLVTPQSVAGDCVSLEIRGVHWTTAPGLGVQSIETA